MIYLFSRIPFYPIFILLMLKLQLLFLVFPSYLCFLTLLGPLHFYYSIVILSSTYTLAYFSSYCSANVFWDHPPCRFWAYSFMAYLRKKTGILTFSVEGSLSFYFSKKEESWAELQSSSLYNMSSFSIITCSLKLFCLNVFT